MFKLMGKEINAILGAQTFLIWAYESLAKDKDYYFEIGVILGFWLFFFKSLK